MRARVPALLSAAVLLAGLAAALDVWPRDSGDGLRFATPHPIALPAAEALPAFVLDGSGPAVRLGLARPGPGGALVVVPYAERRAGIAEARFALLAGASPGFLWHMAPPEARDAVREVVRGLTLSVRDAVGRIAASEHFRDAYRPRLEAIAVDAAKTAADAPETRAALDGAVDAAGTILGEEVARLFPEVIGRNLSGALVALGSTVFDASRYVVERLLGGKDVTMNPDSVRKLFRMVLDDPQVKEALSRQLARFAATPQAQELMRVFSGRFLAALSDDRRLGPLVEAVLGDPAFAADLNALEDETVATVRLAAQRILGGRDGTLDPLAAVALNGLMRGRTPPVVLVARPGSEGALPSGTLYRRETASEATR